ncbi:MAG: hypothetical protein DF199_08200 [Lactobacillus delbrueckii subsp. lactis]|nr:MAG: hypothetical protein DF199_08200 [Lactobacillus delbrueckii subsp. lactis]
MKKTKYLTLLSVAALTLLTSGLGSQAVLADTDTAQTTNTSTNTTTDTSKTSTALNANFPGFYNSMSKKPTITAFFEV